jgi:Domain of unknown function (DUF4413)
LLFVSLLHYNLLFLLHCNLLVCIQVGAPSKRPAWDVPTKWNSTYLMLELVLELCEAVNRFATLDKRYLLCPSQRDWDNFNALVGCLKVFYDATMKLSGTNYPTLNMFFTEFCEVYLTIKKMGSSSFPFIIQMGKEMYEKWDKYWSSGKLLVC